MRFILFSVFGAAWLVLWWWTYVYHIKGIETEAEFEERIQYVADANLPLSFKWSDPTPIISDRFAPWRDSILRSLQSDQVLQITGIHYRDEIPHEAAEDLGAQRVKAILHAFGTSLPMERVIVESFVGEVSSDIRHRNFPGYRMQILTRNEDVKETTDCALIHFPYDSTKQAINLYLLNYVSSVKKRLENTGESLKLVTLVQEQSQAATDSLLTSWRLVALKNLIVNAGVADYRIALANKSDEAIEQCVVSELNDQMQQDWIAALFVK